MYDVTLRHVHETIVAVKKQYYIFLSERVCVWVSCVHVALLIQQAVRMRCILLSSVGCPAATFFHIIS